MGGEQIREFQLPRFAIVLAVIGLFSAVLTPMAGASSPSQDQYGSALPGVGGSGGGSPSGTPQSTIPVAPSSSSSAQKSGSESTSSGGNGGGSSHAGSKGRSSHKSKGTERKGSHSNNGQHPVSTDNASVPHIAADSAGDSWVPWFIGGLLALGAAGGVLLYRNRRRAAQS